MCDSVNICSRQWTWIQSTHVVDNVVYMDKINICSGHSVVWIQSTYVVDNVVYMDTVRILSTHVVDNVVYMDTVNIFSGQCGRHGYSQHM